MPVGSKTRGGLDEEWLTEQELLASLLEATVNRGLKKSKRAHIPRPQPDLHQQAKSKKSAVDRMVAMAKRIGGG